MLLANLAPEVILAVLLAIAAAVLLVTALSVALFFRHWLRALLSGAPVSLMSLIGMRLRRSNIDAILKARILAAHNGVDAPVGKLEQAYLAGANLEKLVLAAAALKDRGEEISWEDLLKASRAGRLAKMLSN